MPTNHSEPVKTQTDIPEDEIELIDLLRVIWKWKYLIIGGTVACALAALIISSIMPKIYQVSMVLKPGIAKIDINGKPVYLDSVGNIKSLIEGELLFKVLDHSKNRNKSGGASSGGYKITAGTNKNTLSILYESPDREEGVENLNYLINALVQYFDKRIKYIHNQLDNEIISAKQKLALKKNEEEFIRSKINEIQKKMDEYVQKGETKKNTAQSRIKSKSNLLDYASIVEILINLKRKYSDINLQIALVNKTITDLEKEKQSKQAIIVAQPPTAGQHPIKPNKRRNVMLATIAGLFMMVFLSFFLEYISKNKGQTLSAG